MISMSTQFNLNNHSSEYNNTHGKVKVTDLLTRLNEEKKNRKKEKSCSWGCCSVSSYSFWYYSNDIIKIKLSKIHF